MLNGIYLCMLTRLLDGVFSDRAAPKIKHERLTLQLVQPAVCIFFGLDLALLARRCGDRDQH